MNKLFITKLGRRSLDRVVNNERRDGERIGALGLPADREDGTPDGERDAMAFVQRERTQLVGERHLVGGERGGVRAEA